MVKSFAVTALCAAILLYRKSAHGHGIHFHDEGEHDHSSYDVARDLKGDDGEPLVQDIEIKDRKSGKKQLGVRCAFAPNKKDQKRMLRQQDIRRLQVPTSPVNIAVKVHVISHPLGLGNVSDQVILNQMAVLNATYASSMFSFTLDPAVDIIRRVNSTLLTTCYTQRDAMKQMWGIDVANYMNVYLCRPTGGILGHSTFPNSPAAQNDTRHGVIIHSDTLPGGAFKDYNQGFTLTHEAGHYLGLQHVFQGGCAASPTAGDGVADTPAQNTSTYGCPAVKDTCGSNGTDDISNFMDYSFDTCMNHFTPGQVVRMHSQTSFYRKSLYY